MTCACRGVLLWLEKLTHIYGTKTTRGGTLKPIRPAPTAADVCNGRACVVLQLKVKQSATDSDPEVILTRGMVELLVLMDFFSYL